jgi:hypothetical protein
MGSLGLGEFVIIFLIFFFLRYLYKLSFKKREYNSESSVDLDRLIVTNYKKVKKYAKISISKSYMTNCSWLLVNSDEKGVLYTFRSNDELLVTKKGFVEKLGYELIVDNNSILISNNGIIEHFNIVNVHDDFLFLNRLSSNKILVFANQTKYKDELLTVLKQKAKLIYDYKNVKKIGFK